MMLTTNLTNKYQQWAFTMEQALVYVVIINDRHEDIDAEVFSTKEAAISRAKEVVADWKMGDGYDDDDDDDSVAEGDTIFYERYSPEDDYVCVIKRSLQ